VERATAEAGTTPVAAPILAADAYLAKIDGLLYGDDPKDGVVRGQRFLHPVLRIAFEVPAGFRLSNSVDEVTAKGPGEDSAISFDRATKGADSDVADYLTQTWATKFNLEDVGKFTVNGLPAATGHALVDTDSGRLWVRMTVIRVEDAMYRFLFIASSDQADRLDAGFQSTAASFRRLSASEAAAIKPLRIKIVTVRAGDTLASLAQRLPFPDYREERFRTLNGLEPGDRISAGQRVKIVVE
jgi:predicted Zn-dependent protease